MIALDMRVETPRLILRPFAATDAEAVSRCSREPGVARYLSDMILETAESARGWIQWILSRQNAEEPFMALAVEIKPRGELIGLVAVAPKKEIGGEIEIVYAISDGYQGNGYATEAGRAVIGLYFGELGKTSLSALVKPENLASRRVAEKLGFQYRDTRMLPYDGRICAFDYFRLQRPDKTT